MFTLTTSKALLASIALLATAGPDCEGRNCTPTETAATPADKVSVRNVNSSSVVTARLSAEDAPLGGKNMTFDILEDGNSLYQGTASTGDDGTARFDLKRVEPAALASLARADEFRASFAGDATYCSSNDTADFHLTTV